MVSESIKVANLLYNGIEKLRIFKTFNFWVFCRKNLVFWKEKFDFFRKIAECSKLAVKCDWKSKTSPILQNLAIKNKILGFFEKNWFCRNRQRQKFVVGCNWIIKISQNVQKLVSSSKKMVVQNLSWVFLETAKSNQFDADCSWIRKISQNVRILSFLFEKTLIGFSKKCLLFFKIAKIKKVARQGHWKCKNSQNVQKFGVFPKKMDGFFDKISLIFKKLIKVANLL